MKQRLLSSFAACTLLTVTAFAQLPNGDLENWSVYTSVASGITCDVPDGWDVPDKIAADLGISERTVERESVTISSGTFSAKLTTKELNVLGTPLLVPGTITTGIIGFDFGTFTPSVTGGAPVSSAPTSLEGFFKYSPAGADTMNVTIIMLMGEDTVGYGNYRDGSTTSGFVAFSAAINYFLPGPTPDQMQIIITSSGSFETPSEGSVLYIDDMSVTGGINVEEWASLGIKPNIYPNPASDHININNPASNDVMMDVYNLQGQKIESVTLTPDMNTINLANYASGIYTFRLMDNGVQVYSSKFKVAK